MTTIREDIALARLSYVEDLANDPQWQAMEKLGWQHIGRSDKLLVGEFNDDAESNGFSADAFRSPSGQILIANRGTEITSIKDLWADFQILLGIEPGQADSARAFVDEVRTKLKGDGEVVTSIHMVGHSLGDYLAQIATEYVNIKYEGVIHATGFGLNGPGIGEADTSSTDFVHLQLDSDLVNRVGGDHLGVNFTIDSITPKYSPLEAHFSDLAAKKIDVFFSKLGDMTSQEFAKMSDVERAQYWQQTAIPAESADFVWEICTKAETLNKNCNSIIFFNSLELQHNIR